MAVLLWLYGCVLTLVFAAPGALALSARTYPFMSEARFAAFLGSVVLFVALGRHLARTGRRRTSLGLFTGLLTGFIGTLAYQAAIRMPPAVRSLAATLPGVPGSAVATMLGQHRAASALLSGLIAAVLNALLGAVAVYWGGRSRRRKPAPQAGGPGEETSKVL